jgi:hypothetical protein
MRVSCEPVQQDVRRVSDEGRQFIVYYWLLRQRVSGGATSFAVRCCANEIREGSVVSQQLDIVGLGADPVHARVLYGRMVQGAVLPAHLRDLANDALVPARRAAGEGSASQGGDQPKVARSRRVSAGAAAYATSAANAVAAARVRERPTSPRSQGGGARP